MAEGLYRNPFTHIHPDTKYFYVSQQYPIFYYDEHYLELLCLAIENFTAFYNQKDYKEDAT